MYIAEKCDFCTFFRIQIKIAGFPVQKGPKVLHLVSDFCTDSPPSSRIQNEVVEGFEGVGVILINHLVITLLRFQDSICL